MAGNDTRSGNLDAWRLLDMGSLRAAENMAIDAVLLEARAAGAAPSTIRFLGFSRPSVLVGYHQSVMQEVRTAYCRERRIDINRRVTGGGAVYFDETQLGWEVIALKEEIGTGPAMTDITARVCQAAVSALGDLGIGARFRPRNDIEVGGRKICGTGGAYEGEAFLFQGTLLVDFDPEQMIRALRVPTEKLAKRELSSARERVTCLSDLLARVPEDAEIKAAFTGAFTQEFGIALEDGSLTMSEQERLEEVLPHYRSDQWVNSISEPLSDSPILRSIHRGGGGLIRMAVACDARRSRIKSLNITGDFFIEPRRAIFDLESKLKDCRLEDIESEVSDFFAAAQPECLGLDAGDFVAGLLSATEKVNYPDLGVPPEDLNSLFLIGGGSLTETLERTGMLLLPYCAKLVECDYRTLDGCDECGDCSIGDAYGLARARGITVRTVHNYEQLVDILSCSRQEGVEAFIGCCCQAFLAKHYRTFADSGLACVILDIEDTTCFELSMEMEAYQGLFENQTNLKSSLLERMIDLIPVKPKGTGEPLRERTADR